MVDKIKVGDKDYKVKVDPEITDRGAAGEVNYKKAIINVANDLDDQVLKEVLVHEAVHAMLEFMGESQNNEEELVIRIANGVCMLIKDNPELFLQFTQKHRTPKSPDKKWESSAIDVVRFDDNLLHEDLRKFARGENFVYVQDHEGERIELEGRILAQKGDYIIRGSQGELYSCKPDAFEATHRKVGR